MSLKRASQTSSCSSDSKDLERQQHAQSLHTITCAKDGESVSCAQILSEQEPSNNSNKMQLRSSVLSSVTRKKQIQSKLQKKGSTSSEKRDTRSSSSILQVDTNKKQLCLKRCSKFKLLSNLIQLASSWILLSVKHVSIKHLPLNSLYS